MFRKNYNQLNSQIIPSEDLIHNTIKATKKLESQMKPRALIKWNKPALAIISIFLCLTLGVPVLASHFSPIHELMYWVSPSFAQFFMPVEMSDIDNDIELEVVSVYLQEHTAEIYLTLEDLSGNSRIDETTDLNNSYSIHKSFTSVAGCQLLGYDEATQKATFLISISEYIMEDITSDKITFSINEFFSNKDSYEDHLIPITLASLPTDNKYQSIRANGGSGIDANKYVDFEKDLSALIPTTYDISLPLDNVFLTGVGYIDGKLHIQSSVKSSSNNYSKKVFHLKDIDGNRVDSIYTFSFTHQNNNDEDYDYNNYVFDIPQEDIGKFTLHGDFESPGIKTKGNWKVTFPIK